MASLSANARRNSNAVTTLTKNLKPNTNGTAEQPISSTMLKTANESDDDVAFSFNALRPQIVESFGNQLQNTKICNERSDSGFSETNCINQEIPPGKYAHTVRESVKEHRKPVLQNDRAEPKIGEKLVDISSELEANVPEPVVKTRTEQKAVVIVENTAVDRRESLKITSPNNVKEKVLSPKIASPVQEKNVPLNVNLARSQSLQNRKSAGDHDSVRKSDFTNTIQMRKKSLESNAFKERTLTARTGSFLKPTGKVFSLLQKFGSETKVDSLPKRIDRAIDIHDEMTSQPAKVAVSNTSIAKNATKSKNGVAVGVVSVFDRLSPNKNAAIQKPKQTNPINTIRKKSNPDDHVKPKMSTSPPSQPSPFNRSAEIRLSARVKEVTERLSVPKVTKSTTIGSTKSAVTSTPKSPNMSKDRYRQCRNIFNVERETK